MRLLLRLTVYVLVSHKSIGVSLCQPCKPKDLDNVRPREPAHLGVQAKGCTIMDHQPPAQTALKDRSFTRVQDDTCDRYICFPDKVAGARVASSASSTSSVASARVRFNQIHGPGYSPQRSRRAYFAERAHEHTKVKGAQTTRSG